jgi:hypothetical protein
VTPAGLAAADEDLAAAGRATDDPADRGATALGRPA